MSNLVISVSPDSSLELLKAYADVIVLDEGSVAKNSRTYDTVYIRSHFSDPSTLPQVFRSEIDKLVEYAKVMNPQVRFIDNMDTVDAIVTFEDKWHQYELFGKFMPHTQPYGHGTDITSFKRPIFKNRLSSRGSGVTWEQDRVAKSNGEWIVQESLDIREELRIYVIQGEVYPIGAMKQVMTEGNKAHALSCRTLSQDEIDFSLSVMKMAPSLDIVGIDVARTSDGQLALMEVNRSPGFAKFYELSGVNIAETLYGSVGATIKQAGS